MATLTDGTTRRFRTATAFARWRLAGNGGPLIRVVDISAAPVADKQPAPDGNRGPVIQQRH